MLTKNTRLIENSIHLVYLSIHTYNPESIWNPKQASFEPTHNQATGNPDLIVEEQREHELIREPRFCCILLIHAVISSTNLARVSSE